MVLRTDGEGKKSRFCVHVIYGIPQSACMCGGCGVVDWWFAIAVPFGKEREGEWEIDIRDAAQSEFAGSLAPSFLFP